MNKNLLPHDKEAEQGVLGSIIHNNGAIDQVKGILEPNHFFSPGHTRIYRAMLELNRDEQPIDEITIGERLGRKGTLEESGGLPYIAELVDLTPVASNVLVYAGVVLAKWRARRLIEMATEAATIAHNTGDAEEAADMLRAELAALGAGSEEAQGISLKTALIKFLDWFKLPVSEAPGFQAYWYIAALDGVVGGIPDDRPVLVAARTGVGKTIMLTQTAVRNAMAGIPTLLVDLEMGERIQIGRMLSAQSKVVGDHLLHKRHDEMPDAEWESLGRAVDKLAGIPLYIWSPGRFPTVLRIEQECQRHIEEYKVRLVLVDQLSRIKARGVGDYERQTLRMEQLTAMRKHLGIPVVIAAQINRSGVKAPGLENLRGSGELEDNASQVLILEDPTPEVNDGHEIKIIIAKGGNSRKGEIWVNIIPWRYTIE